MSVYDEYVKQKEGDGPKEEAKEEPKEDKA